MAKKKPTAKKKTPRKPRKPATKPTKPEITVDTPLTTKELCYCHEYAIDLNQTAAAKRSGFSEKSARSIASELMTKPNVAAKIKELLEARLKEADAGSQRVIQELERIGFSKLTDVVSWNESGMVFIKDSDSLEPEVAAAIESVEVTEQILGKDDDQRTVIKTKVKMHSKPKTLETLCKYHGLLTDKLDVNHTGDVNITVMNYAKGKKGG